MTRSGLVLTAAGGVALALAVGVGFRLRAGAPDVSVGGESFAGLCWKASEVFCDRLQACGGLDRAQRRACLEHHARDCDAKLGWRVRHGILATQPEAFEECLEGLQRTHCNAVQSVLGDDDQDVLELTTQCEVQEMFQATSQQGAPCGLPEDCVNGSCPYAESGCHVCRPFAALGAPCAKGFEQCDPKVAYCAVADGKGKCARRVGAGERCSVDEACGPAQRCAPWDGGVCVALRKNGEACQFDEHFNVCAEGEAGCVGGRCAVRPFDVPAGQACRAFADCAPGTYCRTDPARGASVCARQGGPGAPCAAEDYGACAMGTRCVDGACWPLLSAGARCPEPYTCKAELSCVPESPAGFADGGRCLPAAELGQACGPHRPCRRGLCEGSSQKRVCVPLKARGESCDVDRQCESGACSDRGDAGGYVCGGGCPA